MANLFLLGCHTGQLGPKMSGCREGHKQLDLGDLKGLNYSMSV